MKPMNKVMHSVYVAVLFSAVVFNAAVYAHSSPTAQDDPCPAPNIRTDVRPNAGGQPIKVTVGIYMIDLMEINDIKQTLTGDFEEQPYLPLSDLWERELRGLFDE